MKSYTKTINLKYQLQNEVMDLNYMKYHILYQILKIIFRILKKNLEKKQIIL